MTSLEFIDELTYRNYAHNRRISPQVTPERWEKAYGPNAVAMEERFQREQTIGGMPKSDWLSLERSHLEAGTRVNDGSF